MEPPAELLRHVALEEYLGTVVSTLLLKWLRAEVRLISPRKTFTASP